MKSKRFIIFTVCLLAALNLQGMTRTIRKEPAVVLAAFGTTTKAKATYEFIDRQVKSNKSLKNIRLEWAFTSEIVRERANQVFEKQGSPTRYLSLPQVLANLEAEGYRKVVVQPLHIFPGQEYDEVKTIVQAFSLLGLRMELGETLLHEWPTVHEVVDIVAKDFLPPEKGCNVIVSHGTPQTFFGANSTYLGLERYVTGKYDHVHVGAVDGILTREQALTKAKQCKHKAVRFISFMLVAGDHIMNDIMAPEPNSEGEISWLLEMKKEGFSADTLQVTYNGENLYKGLGFNQAIVAIFIRSIEQALAKLEQ